MKKTLAAICAAGTVLLGGSTALGVDSYIVEGYPPENLSYSRPSTGVAMETSGTAEPSSPFALEARYRSILESIGIKLNTYMATGFLLFLR